MSFYSFHIYALKSCGYIFWGGLSLKKGTLLRSIKITWSQFTFLKFFLICPLDPVRGLMFVIFTIAALKSVENLAIFEEQVVVWESAEPPLNSCWSECRTPFLFNKFLQQKLSKTQGVEASRGQILLSPVLFRQFDFSDVARDVSMLVSLYMRLRKLLLLACPMV